MDMDMYMYAGKCMYMYLTCLQCWGQAPVGTDIRIARQAECVRLQLYTYIFMPDVTESRPITIFTSTTWIIPAIFREILSETMQCSTKAI